MISGLVAAIPWVAILGFFGMILKVRVSGDPALWKRVEALEAKLEQQTRDFATRLQAELEEERAECARKLGELEGQIRQLQQQQVSFGNMAQGDPMCGTLRTAFAVPIGNKDADLLKKLNRIPGNKKK